MWLAEKTVEDYVSHLLALPPTPRGSPLESLGGLVVRGPLDDMQDVGER